MSLTKSGLSERPREHVSYCIWGMQDVVAAAGWEFGYRYYTNLLNGAASAEEEQRRTIDIVHPMKSFHVNNVFQYETYNRSDKQDLV